MSAKNETPKVIRMEDILGDTKNANKNEENDTKTTTTKQKQKPKAVQSVPIPKGKPKSGRVWKSEKKKFSSIIKTRGLKSSFEKKQALREKLQKIKEASRERIAQKKEEAEMKKQRRRDNLKKQEENRKKSEIVQVITNTKKLKNMKRKQLRYIEKRDTTVVSK
ncbi:unnamed protein product [Ceutorhynchus assimilis]|uniref:Coiled-coil domain-containing protein 86 n=1 Tax=Ceutorhynchus assimilis TaxID=467358 RepID=A0A9N9MI39_9CUCU|nr:unnamed protein product [Ceutorhynchus assimilis]